VLCILRYVTYALPVKSPALGEKIRSARKRAGLSHDKLGAVVGTSRQHLIRLEKGWHRPSPELLARIADATGQPVESFASDDDDEDADQPMPAMSLDDFLRLRVSAIVNEALQAARA
jgi:transcriptional regulator with XRE-family HTH domain